jgi:AraC-like DNA-binding protein
LLARARAVMLSNYHEVAHFVGLNPHAMLARAAIKPAALNDPENWLPAAKVLALIDESAARSGRDDFGLLLGKCRSFTSIGPLSLLLKHEASVREIILAGVEYKHLLNDLLHISLRDDGEHAIVEWSLIPGLDSAHGVNLVAAIAYRGISEALESTWEPDCIHFRHAAPDNAATFRHYFQCPLEFDSHFDGMSCTSAYLQTPNPFANCELASYARRLLDLLPGVRSDSESDKVRSVIPLLIEDGQATAERVAECLGVPVRTLQRRLVNEGSTFTELLNQCRRDLVVRYMTSSSHDLALVAHLAGYSSLSAFSRWFSGEFGVAPAIWRKRRREELKQLRESRCRGT